MDDRPARLEWFKATILPHEGEVRARLRRICKPGFDIENLLAESLSRAYLAHDFNRIVSGRSYLFKIARNLLINLVRKDRIVSLDFVADFDALLVDDSTSESLSARDELRTLLAVVEKLPMQCRRVFLLRRVYDYSPGEIAAQMSLSVSTVEKHLAKAILLVANGLAEVEGTGIARSASTETRSSGARRDRLSLRR
jgi:RNA polymerase sigma-70 factor (ECF subfamily)